MPVKTFRKMLFNGLFVNQRNMRGFMGLLRFYQKYGIQTLTRKMGIINIFLNGMSCLEKVLPKIQPMSKMKQRPLEFKATGEKQATVALVLVGFIVFTK